MADKHVPATHDQLTGLLNRRAIVIAGEREVAVALRRGDPRTVAFVDIDFLKQVNDGLSHEAGDRAIADVATRLSEACRQIHLVGRYGGDEFCIVFPCANSQTAALIGERLLTSARQYTVDDRHPLTLSVGMASLPANGEESWASQIRSADLALYDVKAQGRDRFCLAAEIGSGH